MTLKFSIHPQESVFTEDNTVLGQVNGLFRQPDDAQVNPDLKLYRHYIYITDQQTGGDYYVPTDFVSRENNQLRLAMTTDDVLHETFDREPQFIALGQAQEIDLKPPPHGKHGLGTL